MWGWVLAWVKFYSQLLQAVMWRFADIIFPPFRNGLEAKIPRFYEKSWFFTGRLSINIFWHFGEMVCDFSPEYLVQRKKIIFTTSCYPRSESNSRSCSVYSSSCNYPLFGPSLGHLRSLSFYYHPQGKMGCHEINRERKEERMRQKRDIYMNCRTQKW